MSPCLTPQYSVPLQSKILYPFMHFNTSYQNSRDYYLWVLFRNERTKTGEPIIIFQNKCNVQGKWLLTKIFYFITLLKYLLNLLTPQIIKKNNGILVFLFTEYSDAARFTNQHKIWENSSGVIRMFFCVPWQRWITNTVWPGEKKKYWMGIVIWFSYVFC